MLAALALVVFGAYDSYPVFTVTKLGWTQELENATSSTASVGTMATNLRMLIKRIRRDRAASG